MDRTVIKQEFQLQSILQNYNVNHIVVEHNLTIIPKEQYDQTILKDGDEVEIVSFMGGGC